MANLFLLPTAKSRWAVCWWLILFACGQLALGVCLHHYSANLCDPVYGNRYRSLQEQIAQHPDRPLVLTLGSSRVMNGIRPTAITFPDQSLAPFPLVYNFAISGSGPVCTRLTFQRLLGSGVRPKWLLVETWPLFWPQALPFDEKQTLRQLDLRSKELPLLLRYFSRNWDMLGKALSHDVAPLVAYRSRLLHAAAISLLPPQVADQLSAESRDWQPPDGTGWIPVRDESAAQRRAIELGQATAIPLLNPLRIHPSSDRAIRDLLEDCKEYHIPVAFLLMPEHSMCRSWYSAQAKELVRSYLDGLIRDYHITIMDMRDWLPDDDFADYCHIARAAAAPFSERFGREMLYPWLSSQKNP